MRPPKPGPTERQATLFRRFFRGVCDKYGVTHSRLGDALDAHSVLRGGWEEGNGNAKKAVDNAMMSGRKLTHVWVRRLVAALMLSKTRAGGYAIADDFVATTEVYAPLLRRLKKIGALHFGPEPIPIFIALEYIEELADVLAAVAARIPNIGSKQKAAITSAFVSYLRKHAPAMNHAWFNDMIHVMGILKYRHSEMGKARDVLGRLSRDVFRDQYVERSGPSMPSELAIISEQRHGVVAFLPGPDLSELTKGLELIRSQSIEERLKNRRK